MLKNWISRRFHALKMKIMRRKTRKVWKTVVFCKREWITIGVPIYSVKTRFSKFLSAWNVMSLLTLANIYATNFLVSTVCYLVDYMFLWKFMEVTLAPLNMYWDNDIYSSTRKQRFFMIADLWKIRKKSQNPSAIFSRKWRNLELNFSHMSAMWSLKYPKSFGTNRWFPLNIINFQES